MKRSTSLLLCLAVLSCAGARNRPGVAGEQLKNRRCIKRVCLVAVSELPRQLVLYQNQVYSAR